MRNDILYFQTTATTHPPTHHTEILTYTIVQYRIFILYYKKKPT